MHTGKGRYREDRCVRIFCPKSLQDRRVRFSKGGAVTCRVVVSVIDDNRCRSRRFGKRHTVIQRVDDVKAFRNAAAAAARHAAGTEAVGVGDGVQQVRRDKRIFVRGGVAVRRRAGAEHIDALGNAVAVIENDGIGREKSRDCAAVLNLGAFQNKAHGTRPFFLVFVEAVHDDAEGVFAFGKGFRDEQASLFDCRHAFRHTAVNRHGNDRSGRGRRMEL